MLPAHSARDDRAADKDQVNDIPASAVLSKVPAAWIDPLLSCNQTASAKPRLLPSMAGAGAFEEPIREEEVYEHQPSCVVGTMARPPLAERFEIGTSDESLAFFAERVFELETHEPALSKAKLQQFFVDQVIRPALSAHGIPVPEVRFSGATRLHRFAPASWLLTISDSLFELTPRQQIGRIAHELVHVEEFCHRIHYLISEGKDVSLFDAEVVAEIRMLPTKRRGSEAYARARELGRESLGRLFNQLSNCADRAAQEFSNLAIGGDAQFTEYCQAMLALIANAVHGGYRASIIEAAAFAVEARVTGAKPFVPPTLAQMTAICGPYYKLAHCIDGTKKAMLSTFLQDHLGESIAAVPADRSRYPIAEQQAMGAVLGLWRTMTLPLIVTQADPGSSPEA